MTRKKSEWEKKWFGKITPDGIRIRKDLNLERIIDVDITILPANLPPLQQKIAIKYNGAHPEIICGRDYLVREFVPGRGFNWWMLRDEIYEEIKKNPDRPPLRRVYGTYMGDRFLVKAR